MNYPEIPDSCPPRLRSGLGLKELLGGYNGVTAAMRDETVTRDDELVWDTPTGTTLWATETKHMEGEEDQEPVFTAGRAYQVVSMHPIAAPAFVRVIDDQGSIHTLHGEHIRAWFARVPPNG